jgi:hypothetical protein
MWFNSLEFGAFLVLVFAGYWMLSSNRLKGQNLLLLGASYFFTVSGTGDS